jgi:hypothetical protein
VVCVCNLSITGTLCLSGRGKGTPLLRNGIRSIGVELDEESEASDWQGFDWLLRTGNIIKWFQIEYTWTLFYKFQWNEIVESSHTVQLLTFYADEYYVPLWCTSLMWMKPDVGKLVSIIHTFKQHNIPAIVTRFYTIFILHADVKGGFWLCWPVLHLCSSQQPVHCHLRGAWEFCQWISMPDIQ